MTVSSLSLAALLVIGTSATALATLKPVDTGSVTFVPADTQSLREALNFELIENGFLDVTIVNGVATIVGYAHASDIEMAQQVTQRTVGIDRVVVTAATIN